MKSYVFGQLDKHGLLSTSPLFISTYNKSTDQSKLNCWQPLHIMCNQAAFQQEHTKYAPKQSRWHFKPSVRNFNWTDNKAQWLMRKENIQRRLVSFSKITNKKTHHQPKFSGTTIGTKVSICYQLHIKISKRTNNKETCLSLLSTFY